MHIIQNHEYFMIGKYTKSSFFQIQQAMCNSENCGPYIGKLIGLEVDKRSRSQHVTIQKENNHWGIRF